MTSAMSPAAKVWVLMMTNRWSDEPETPGDWGTELNATLAEWKVDWKKAYVAYKFELSGE